MKDFPPLCIVDTNVLIDLHVGGLLRELFRLPFRLAAPDVIVAELYEPDGETLVGYGLESVELAGDQVLSEAADQEGVMVHGILWVLDEMVRLKIVAPIQAAQALERMLKQGSRLPRAECQKRLREWRAR